MRRAVIMMVVIFGVAIAAILSWRVLRQAETSSPTTPGSTGGEALARGRNAFFAHCVVCHSPDSDDAANGPSMMGYFNRPSTKLSDGRLYPHTAAAVREMIANGTGNMPPLDKEVTAQEIEDILAYLHTL